MRQKPLATLDQKIALGILHCKIRIRETIPLQRNSYNMKNNFLKMSRKYGAIYKACKKNKYMFTLFYDPQFIQYAAAWNF